MLTQEDQSTRDNRRKSDLASLPLHRGRTVAYVGQLSLEKGVHCLIAALPEIVMRVPDAHLLLIGQGVARESLEEMVMALVQGDLRAATQALAGAPLPPQTQSWLAPVTLFWERVDKTAYLAGVRAADLAGRVTFTGHLAHTAVARVLPEVELLVIPSLVEEAFPLVSLEALACGVLPVASYSGGLIPILDEVAAALGPLGELIRLDPQPEAFVTDLADKVARLLQHLAIPDIREQTAQRCRTIAVRNYDWDQVVGRLEQVYEEALTTTPRQTSDEVMRSTQRPTTDRWQPASAVRSPWLACT